jgi:hypothetical protein
MPLPDTCGHGEQFLPSKLKRRQDASRAEQSATRGKQVTA